MNFINAIFLGPLAQIDAAVCWYPPHGLLAQLPQLQLVQSLAAGVEKVTIAE